MDTAQSSSSCLFSSTFSTLASTISVSPDETSAGQFIHSVTPQMLDIGSTSWLKGEERWSCELQGSSPLLPLQRVWLQQPWEEKTRISDIRVTAPTQQQSESCWRGQTQYLPLKNGDSRCQNELPACASKCKLVGAILLKLSHTAHVWVSHGRAISTHVRSSC